MKKSGIPVVGGQLYRWLGCLILTGALSTSQIVVAIDNQSEALRWLDDAKKAVSGSSYTGEVAASAKDRSVESFKLFHSVKSGIEQERLISLNTPLREVIRKAGEVACYFPDSKSVYIETKSPKRSALLDLPDDLTQVLRYYRLGLHGQEWVIGRQAQVISVEPRDEYRYARLIWVDTKTKLPVKFEMLDQDGQVAEQMIFTSLSLEPEIASSDLESSLKSEAQSWTYRKKELLPLESLSWSLQDVPTGFQLASYTRMQHSAGDRSVEHILLSDGFSSVSVYIEPLKGEFKEHPRKIGAINARTVKIDEFSITVMGEVPDKTIDVIARGLKHQVRGSP